MSNQQTFLGSIRLGELAESVGLILCDVGSRGGALEDFHPAAPFTQVIGFEPDEEECSRLNHAAADGRNAWRAEKHHQVALGREEAELDLRVCNDRFYSSTLEPEQQLPMEFGREQDFRVVDRLKMNVRCMNHFLPQQEITDIDFIKVDVQGTELEILQGGSQIIESKVLGVRSEVEFSSLYVNQPLFSEMELHLRAQGFYLADWLYQRHWRNTPAHEHAQYNRRSQTPYSRGRLIHSDALFLRDHHWVARHMEDAETKLCRLILIALLYHHIDLAGSILPLIRENSIIKGVPSTVWQEELATVSKTLWKQQLREQGRQWIAKAKRTLRHL